MLNISFIIGATMGIPKYHDLLLIYLKPGLPINYNKENIKPTNIRKSVIICSQYTCERWTEQFDDPINADVIVDRLIHKPYKVYMNKGSIFKTLTSILPCTSYLGGPHLALEPVQLSQDSVFNFARNFQGIPSERFFFFILKNSIKFTVI